MTTQFQVDTDLIQAGASDIARIAADIETQVQAMMGRLDSLQDAWRGTAATRFAAVAAQWQSTQRQVRESLDSIGQVLGQAGTNYAEAEATATRMFG